MKQIFVNNCYDCSYRDANIGGKVPHYCKHPNIVCRAVADEDWEKYCPLKESPSIQPKTGHWIKETSTDMCDEIETYWVCSECGRDVGNGMANLNDVIKDYPYCHCGAKMIPTDSEKE